MTPKTRRATRRGFRPVPASAPKSRQFVRDTLRQWGLTELTEAALIAVSELVTNSVLHARTPIDIEVIANETKVRFSVSDGSASPAFRAQTLLALDGRETVDGNGDLMTGRGMLIVAAMVDALGEAITADGKTVWFDLLLRGSRAGNLSNVVVVQEGLPSVADIARNNVLVRFTDVPSADAVTLAEDIDGAVREAQLDGDSPASQRLLACVDNVRTALPHLDGFFDAARTAQARDHARFNAAIAVDRGRTDAAAALDDLVSCLESFGSPSQQPLDVAAGLGRWMVKEVSRQVAGGAPEPWPADAS